MRFYKKVKIEMTRGIGYGQYRVKAKYKNVNIHVHSTDSQTWDYFDDESNRTKHQQALKSCYQLIVSMYKRRKI